MAANKNKLSIIHLTPNRWREYRDIYLEELKLEPSAFLNSYEVSSRFQDSYWLGILEKRSSDLYFVEADDKIIGMAGLTFGVVPKNDHVVSLWGVYIRAGFRNRGIAHLLLQRIISDLKSNKRTLKISFGVFETQKAALNLYKSLGFEKCGLLKKELFVGGTYSDEHLFEKLLTNPE